MPSLNTTEALCAALRDAPGSWITMSNRIWQNWGNNDLSVRQIEQRAEPMRQLVLGLADEVYTDSDTIIFRTRPVETWSDEARAACGGGTVSTREAHDERNNPDVAFFSSSGIEAPLAVRFW